MRQSWTDDRLDDFRGEVNRRFDEVDRRFEAVDRRFDSVDRSLESLQGTIDPAPANHVPGRRRRSRRPPHRRRRDRRHSALTTSHLIEFAPPQCGYSSQHSVASSSGAQTSAIASSDTMEAIRRAGPTTRLDDFQRLKCNLRLRSTSIRPLRAQRAVAALRSVDRASSRFSGAMLRTPANVMFSGRRRRSRRPPHRRRRDRRHSALNEPGAI